MEIKRPASCGTYASSDVFIEVAPGDQGLELTLDSPVKAQFGDQMEATVRKVLQAHGIDNITIRIQDQGALDCTLIARLETALARGADR